MTNNEQNTGPLVLVADDDKTTHLLLRVTLQREGFRVVEALDGRTAVEQARLLRPDLILMDVQMPLLDGFEAVQQLRQEPATHRIPIIFLTATARDPTDVARGFNLGASDYLRKPFSGEELLARAQSKIRAHQLEERLQQRTEELEALVRIGANLNEALALSELADRLLSGTLTQLPAHCAALVLVDEQSKPTLSRLHYAAPDQPTEQKPEVAGTLVGHVLEVGEPVLIKDTQTDEKVKTILNGTDCRAGIAAPLIHRGQKLGAVVLGALQAERFSDGDLRVLRSISEQAALAIRNAQLYAELQQYAQGLETMVEARTAALRSAQAQLVRAEKLASIGTLAAGVAHEVNNPLLPVLMNLEMAIEDIDDKRPVDREMLDVARLHVQRIKGIVKRLLDFARPDKQGMSPVNINDIVNEVLSLAGKQLEHAHVTISTELGQVGSILGSADQLKQVVLNLIVNAMDAMPDGGALTVRSYEQNNEIFLTVKDTGTGIQPDQLPKIFDPFYTTKKEGTGLGLAVSYGLIEGHGGQIEVTSTPGKETQFTIRIPKLQA